MSRPVRAIFGGSFDPPHHAHVMVVLWALQKVDGLRVTIIPAYQHALGKQYRSSFDQRLEMCRRAFALLPQDRIEISSIEKDRGGMSYMIDTIAALEERYPDDDLRLVVGSDLVTEIPTWRRGEEIMRRARPFVVPRIEPGTESGGGVIPMISSSDVRDVLSDEGRVQGDQRDGDDFADRMTTLLPNSVWQYIQEQDLYR